MSTEVKMVYAEVESQLGQMSQAGSGLKPKAEPPITENTLDVVTKLTELLVQLDQLLVRYQTVLLGNVESTRKSVQFMRESDEKVSSSIQTAGSGSKKVTL